MNLTRISCIFLFAACAASNWGCTTPTASSNPPSVSECPQPKFTGRAPADLYNRSNPVAVNLKSGERLYLEDSPGRYYACATCHGRSGNGKGPMSSHFTPPPRNLACVKVANIPDGQIFWTIKNGLPGTDMPAHAHFNDEQIWQLVAYVRSL